MPNTHGRRPPPPPRHTGNRRPSAPPPNPGHRRPGPPPTRTGRPTIDGCAVVALALAGGIVTGAAGLVYGAVQVVLAL